MHPTRPRTRLRTPSRPRSVLLLPALMVAFAPGAVTLLAPQSAAGQSAAGQTTAPPASASERRVIDHDVYGIWRTIGNRGISADGRWVHYTLQYEEADGEMVLREVATEREIRIPRGTQPSFTSDGRHAVFTIRPTREAREAARGNRGGAAQQPPDSLGIVTLASGDMTRIPGVQGWRLASDPEPGAAGWLAYHLHPQASREGDEGEAPRNGTLVVRNLASGDETRHPHATSYTWASTGARLLVSDSVPGAAVEGAQGVRVVTPGSEEVTTVIEAPGSVRGLVMTDGGDQVAFLHAAPVPDAAPDTEEAEAAPSNDRSWTLRHWRSGEAEARVAVAAGHAGLRDGWTLSEFGTPSFSDDGRRIFFGTVPPPPPSPELSDLEGRVDVEIWHWLDSDLMTVQNVRANQERRRTFQAVLHLGTGRGAAGADRLVQLADPALPQVQLPQGGTTDFGLARDTDRYGIEASWESPNFADVYKVDLSTGERSLILERTQGSPSLSPEARYLTWYQPGDSTWYVRDVESGRVRSLSGALPHPVWNEQNDTPSPAGSYGSAGWTRGDEFMLLYDQFDLWAVDPTGRTAPRNVTGGAGREEGLRFRAIRLDRDTDSWAPDAEVFLSVFSPRTKQAGFARTRLDRGQAPEIILLEDRSFSTPIRAADADVLLFSQETFVEFPDLWVSGPDVADRRRVSEANPQQAEYRWGTAELMEWVSADGIPLQGVLMKPEDFDPTRKYPMVVYFYERWSDGLHDHYALVPHRSRIAFPMYTSNDYIVFIPDIVYRDGYPGEGGLNAVNPGIFKLIEAGFVDRERIALQGHSWGGYQIAFMVTRSQNLYRAAAAGAPVANMTSAYGGIRRQTGLVRQFQYERTQSRLGGTLWEMPLRYIENSPLFWVDKIETPLLIMHNDADGHVPWEQGIELFVAMRRLGKPAWMVNYRGEPHWPTTFANRVDWNVRMKQFFDHFLKDAPPPAWLVEGIPAVRRGETLGYEPVVGGSGVTDRYEGNR
jgi:dienelactone hydrolase